MNIDIKRNKLYRSASFLVINPKNPSSFSPINCGSATRRSFSTLDLKELINYFYFVESFCIDKGTTNSHFPFGMFHFKMLGKIQSYLLN